MLTKNRRIGINKDRRSATDSSTSALEQYDQSGSAVLSRHRFVLKRRLTRTFFLQTLFLRTFFENSPWDSMRSRPCGLPARFDPVLTACYSRNAGWSSLVARWAHNPKVGGSNPPPATKVSSMWTLRAKPVSVLSSLVCEWNFISFITNRFTKNRLLYSHGSLVLLIRRRMGVDVRRRLIAAVALTAFEQVFGPVKANSSRNASSRVVRGATMSVRVDPLTVMPTWTRMYSCCSGT